MFVGFLWCWVVFFLTKAAFLWKEPLAKQRTLRKRFPNEFSKPKFEEKKQTNVNIQVKHIHETQTKTAEGFPLFPHRWSFALVSSWRSERVERPMRTDRRGVESGFALSCFFFFLHWSVDDELVYLGLFRLFCFEVPWFVDSLDYFLDDFGRWFRCLSSLFGFARRVSRYLLLFKGPPPANPRLELPEVLFLGWTNHPVWFGLC